MTSTSSEPGHGLRIGHCPGLRGGVVIPSSELRERFSRSSGPGGQSVNTTDSKVELRFAPLQSGAFTDEQRSRLAAALRERLVDGDVIITASEQRSQRQNRVAARERLVAILRTALAPPPPTRRPTKPTRGSQRRRLEAKKQRGATKSGRGQVRDDQA
jgi:ribosome-associated protein